MDRCMDSSEGQDLMLASAEAVRRHGVTESCSVVIDDRRRCVHRGGGW